MRLLLLLSVLALAACGGNLRQAERSAYDLGNAAVAWKPAGLALGNVAVQAPAWLAATDISYRLLYAGEMRRNAYAESRWIAPPAELVERALNRETPDTAGGCGLRLDIDELIQVFDTPQASRSLLDARAALVAPGGDAVLARKAFAVVQPAPGADARGAVAGAAAAVQALGGELKAWLTQAARNSPALAQRCAGR